MEKGNTVIVAVIIAIAMLATVQIAAAGQSMTSMGTIKYENGTTCPYGWDVWMENLNASYGSEPWDYVSEFLPPYWNYQVDGEYETESDYFRVWVESPDKKWYGENTVMYSEGLDPEWLVVAIHITVHEQSLPTETFTKSLPAGWNLISLPLTPTDNSVGAVLSGVSDVVYRYNATSKQFECPSTVYPGIGYFVHVTTPSTWEYEGTPISSTNSGLKSGLNMIGVPNCTLSVTDAMGSADYRYVARWNAADQKFEVYNPSAPEAFHGFTIMTAGEGYFVSAKSDDGAFAISCPG